ncbi:MAG: hypothetical protein KKA07_15465, partial [Bacteroidetes bacterium]|nr:hypothetical protein [Bacteroidota bacterium]
MKKLIFTLGIALIFGSLHAQNWTGLTSGQTDNVSIKLMQSDIESSVVRFNLDGYFSQSVATPRGQAVTFSLNDATKLLVAGAPDLLKATASVVIPDDAEMQISVVNQTYTEITGIDIAPSKGNLTRDVNPADVAYTYGDVYNKDRFFPGTLAELNDPYIIRDYRGQTVVVYPFQYNPVTKTLRVYTSIEVQITRKSANGKNKLVRTQPLKSINAEFSKVYKSHFLNAATANKYTPTEEGGNFLIISYGSFIPAIQPLKEWKQTIGVPTEIVDVSTIGNAAAIKAYILNYYNTNGLTYVLLVGDAAQVPTDHIGGNASDNSYSFVVGTDHNPDLFVGRFSAENIAHVQTQVQRTIEYEMGDNLGTGWLNNALCIGSAEGGGGIGDDDEIDWEHIRNIRTDLLGFTYATGAELYDGSQGGQDAAGDPNPASVSAVLNAGAGMIVYCGHGSDDSFVTTSFSSSNVNTLTNDNKLPFIFSVACVNGNFESQTCFAEAWMRATNGTEPTGAIATLMSTINQSWDPPMEGEDEMADILVESYTNNIKRTFGGISMNGCIKMNETYSSQGDEMTDTWNLFGDPSLMVRTDDAANMTVSHASTVVIG